MKHDQPGTGGQADMEARRRFLRRTLAAGAGLAGASLIPGCATTTRPIVGLAADTIIVNGRIATVDNRDSIAQAAAVRAGRFIAVGSNQEVRALADAQTRVIDAAGRTILPGLIDAHVHMFRAGFWWKHEVRVDEARTLADILAAIRERARTVPAGTWILTLGGWHYSQIAERRMPTRAELDAAAPGHPVYVQALRDVGQMNTAAIRASGVTESTRVPLGVILGKDEAGRFNGIIRGFAGARYAESLFPKVSAQDKLEGLRLVMRDFNAAGLTSVGEGTGFGVGDDDYQVIYELWRRREMSVRMGLHFHANDADEALRRIRDLAPGFGDDWLRFNGMGEIVQTAMWDGFMPARFDVTAAAKGDFRRIIEAGARNKTTFQLHSTIESTMTAMLDVIEDVHGTHPVDTLRIALLHVERITPAIVERLQRLGMGVQMQDRQVLASDIMRENWGAAATDVPPVKSVYDSGLPLGGGTDGTVSASYRPFISLWWLVSGRNWRGDVVRPTQRLTRAQALRVYTRNAAWFTFEENRKGAILPGFLADCIFLDQDFFTMPEDGLRFLRPSATMVGGRIVHGAA